MKHTKEKLIASVIIFILLSPFAICCNKDKICWECTVSLFGSQAPYQREFCQEEKPTSWKDENGNERNLYNCVRK